MSKKIHPVATSRLFTNIFICMKCNAKIRSDRIRVIRGKIKCRKCGRRALRLKAKESRGQKK